MSLYPCTNQFRGITSKRRPEGKLCFHTSLGQKETAFPLFYSYWHVLTCEELYILLNFSKYSFSKKLGHTKHLRILLNSWNYLKRHSLHHSQPISQL